MNINQNTESRTGCLTRRLALSMAMLLACLATATGASAATPASAACQVSCARDAASCQLQNVHDGQAKPLGHANFTRVEGCAGWRVATGSVVMRYRHKGQWFVPPQALAKDSTLASVFAQFAPDACAVPTPACLQQQMGSKVTSRAGHAADSQESAPAGSGEPCARGLPCGQVLGQPGPWRFRLEDAAWQGQWAVRILRGSPPAGVPREFAVPVVAGEVIAAGPHFAAGVAYAYRLMDASGALVASGEFEVLGASRQAALKKLAAERAARAGLSEGAAWTDALAAYGLDWDAHQSTSTR